MAKQTDLEGKPPLEEKEPKHASGMAMLVLNILLIIGSLILFIVCIARLENAEKPGIIIAGLIIFPVYFSLVGPILFAGLKIIKPNEALVLTLFGKYFGTLKNEGFYFVNTFV